VDSSPAAWDRRLWGWAAAGSALLVFVGFAQTFYLKPWFATPALSPLMLTHGVVMTLWVVLLLLQLRLVAIGRTDWHRRLGAFGAILFVAILAIGAATAVAMGRRGFSPASDVTPLMFMAVPAVDLLVFGVLVATALWQRRHSATHKRLMVLATLAILAPAIARLPIDTVRQGGLPVIFSLMALAVIACVVIDTWRHRRLHPAFGWGGALVLLSVPGRVLLAGTDAWNRFASWLIA
jgi:hypothetical protein